jgi:3-oxoacyl-(acyl-carrier-protein) synthase
MKSVAVTGMGTVSCAGSDSDQLWNAVITGTTGIDNGLGFCKGDRDSLSMSLDSIKQAMHQAGWAGLTKNDGFILATTTGQVNLWEKRMISYLKDGDIDLRNVFSKQALGSILFELTSGLSFNGPKLLVSSACSAATQALGIAALWVSSGKVDRCLVGGVEVLSTLTVEGFRSLQLLSSESSTPFDIHRKGINLSEGAGFLCLERSSPRALGYISGFGFSTDGFHMTAPHPEGRGSYLAMKQALLTARLNPADIDWIHMHGTGSVANDLAEGAAVSALFEKEIPFASSTKGVHGHSLAASGAIESIICLKAIAKQKIPATHGLKNPDPRILIKHVSSACEIPVRHVLKSTLGFGGNNAALVFSGVST